MAEAGNIRIGVGGWNFEPWRETFYPKGVAKTRELEYMAGAADLDRDQQHLLRLENARQLPQMA